MKSLSIGLLGVVTVVSLAGNGLLYMRYSTNRPLVTVGGTVITKKQYQDQLEHQAGQQVLSKMVLDKLVAQAAARDGVTPTTKDVDAQIQDIQRRSPQLLTPYTQDPAKMTEFRQDLQSSIALENLRIKDVALTPAQVAAFYTRNSAKFALPQQIQATTVVTKNEVDAATATDLLRQKTPLDVLARQPRMNVVGANGFNPDMTNLPPALKQQITRFVQQAPVGGIRTFPLKIANDTSYLTFRVVQSSHAALPPLAQIRSQVERQARLEHAPAPQVEMARLYQAAKPNFNSDKYATYFDAIQKYPVSQGTDKKTASDR